MGWVWYVGMDSSGKGGCGIGWMVVRLTDGREGKGRDGMAYG
jgi:hypothetical protein